MRKMVAAAAMAAAVALGSTAVNASEMTFRMGHAASSQHVFHTGVEMFRDAVAAKTDGAVTIEIFGDRQLGDDRQLLEGVRLGTIDGALVSSVMFSLVADAPAFDALQLPFLIPSYEALADALTSDTAQRILDTLSERDMKGLGYYEAGLRHFLNSGDAVRTLDDFRGLKTRIVPVPLHREIWDAVGTNPVGIPYGEVYTSLQTGVIDAVEINISSVETENLWESAKNITLTGHYFWPGVLIFNKAKFDQLPEDIQQAMIEAGHESIRPQVEFVAADEERSANVLREKGVTVFDLEELDEMRARTGDIRDRWRENHPLIGEFVDMVESGN